MLYRSVPHKRNHHKAHGFTLIEVLLALVILAIGLTSLLKSNANNIHYAARLKEKTFAHLVAMSAIADIQTQTVKIAAGRESIHSSQLLGTTWYWRATVSQTPIPAMQQITVSVGTQKTGPFTNRLIGYRYKS
ncbi:MAG: type II secretion system minor pseudopilin GspI [Gammaproteobacteria bacterium]